MPRAYLGAPFGGRVGPHIPHPQGIVHSVGEKEVAVRRERDSRDAVCVPSEAQGDIQLPEVPTLHDVVDATGEYHLGRVVEGD